MKNIDRDSMPPLDLARHTAAFIIETVHQAGLRIAIAKHDADAPAMNGVFDELDAMAEDVTHAYRDNISPMLDAILAGQHEAKRNGVTLDGLRYTTAHEAVSAMLLAFIEAGSVAGDKQPTQAEVSAAFIEVMKWSNPETLAGLQTAIKIEHANATKHEALAMQTSADTEGRPTASPEVKRAAMLYKQATEADPALNTTPKVYRYLIETLEPEDGPTSEDAFKKAITRARKIGLLESKRAPRNISRATGKSVVRYDQL